MTKYIYFDFDNQIEILVLLSCGFLVSSGGSNNGKLLIFDYNWKVAIPYHHKGHLDIIHLYITSYENRVMYGGLCQQTRVVLHLLYTKP